MPDPEPVDPPWSNADDPDWTAAVDEVPWQRRDLGSGAIDMIKELSCSNCHHQIAVIYDEQAAEGVRDRDQSEPEVGAECECGYKHIGAPPDAQGCGRFGWIRSPRQWRRKRDA